MSTKLLIKFCSQVLPRAYRAAVGGERTCNPHSANVDGEILKVAQTFSTQASTDMFVAGFMVTYCHAKPLLAVPKAQKASPIIGTSE